MIIGPGITIGAGIQLQPLIFISSWDLDFAIFNDDNFEQFSVFSQATNPSGLFFKDDGTKMYVIGFSSDAVQEYDLSTPWKVETASYAQNVSVKTQEGSPRGLFFKPDGLKMYMLGDGSDSVFQYNLSSAWNVATASYSHNVSITAQETGPRGLFFKDDGTKMYVSGATGRDVNEYDLSVAWDVVTASYLQNVSVATEDTLPSDLFFKDDGTKMYVAGSAGDDVNEYALSSAWNVATASYTQNFSVAAQETAPTGLFFKDDGTKMYVVGVNFDTVYTYNLNTAWDISTAIFKTPTQNYFNVGAEETAPTGLYFKDDGTKMYVVGSTSDKVNEYDLSTPWNISTASYLQNVNILAEESVSRGVFFKDDGTKMYVTGSTGDDVNEYDLSIAWNVATASYLQNVSISAQDTFPQGVFFKPDGLKMYIIGDSGNDVNEYALSSAWNVATASYSQNFSIADTGENTPTGLFFKDDGTKMYVVGSIGDTVNEYALSSAWNVATANYSKNFSVALQESNPQDLYFKPDGTKMYIVGQRFNSVWAYDL